jgi:hypothetical protein
LLNYDIFLEFQLYGFYFSLRADNPVFSPLSGHNKPIETIFEVLIGMPTCNVCHFNFYVLSFNHPVSKFLLFLVEIWHLNGLLKGYFSIPNTNFFHNQDVLSILGPCLQSQLRSSLWSPDTLRHHIFVLLHQCFTTFLQILVELDILLDYQWIMLFWP